MRLRTNAPSTALASALSLSIALPVMAQDTVVVSGSRTRLEARQIGSAVSVVTSEDIEQGQMRTVKEVLQDLPGVQITDNRPGGTTSVGIRGSDNDQVLVLIDGIELGDPSVLSTQFNFDHLGAGDIERMEVLRGNQSSLYGSDAIGGVINIITRQPPEEGTDLNIDAEAGSDGVQSVTASALGNAGPVDYRISVNSYSADGPSLGAPNEDDPSPSEPVEDDPYDRTGVSGQLGWQVNDALRLKAIAMFNETETANDGAAPFEDDSRVDKDESAYALQLIHATDDGRWHNEFSYSHYDAERLYFGPFNPPEGDRYAGDKDNLRFSSSVEVSDLATVAFGFDLEQESTDQLTFFSGSFIEETETDSVFAEAALTPVDDLTLTMAARRDDSDSFGEFDTYRLTAAYLLGDSETQTKLRGSWGTGAKAPGLYQLFDPSYGNDLLTVEESEGYDIGVDIVWESGQLLELSYFSTDVENEIDFLFPAGYINLGQTEAKGVEAYFAMPLGRTLHWSLSYTYLDSHDAVTGEWLGRPRNSATSQLSIAATDRLAIDLRARYRSRNESSFGGATDSFVVLDLLGSFRFSDRIEVYGRLVNLTDEDYQLTWGYNTLDLSAFAGVRIRH